MPEFAKRYGPWALVTGASSGMGAEFARQLAGRGLHVALTARREDRLQDLGSALVSDHGIETRVVPIDLSHRDGPAQLCRAVESLEIGLLINNAGFMNTGDLIQNDREAETRLLDVNCRAPLMLTHTMARGMKTRGRGGIVFVSSTVAFAAVPQWANYVASKAYLLVLAESLAGEMKPHGVDVLALCPGFTRTEFAKLAPINDAIAMNADTVVRFALSKLGKSTIAIPGLFNKFAAMATRAAPRVLNTFIYKQVIGPTQKLN